ncbi:MAG: hypothetical protein M3Z25_05490 [Actinomycetota bacterium]|nr:hypothetical protein [Actinomycetota bacterium]
MRDALWASVPTRDLVPGDVIGMPAPAHRRDREEMIFSVDGLSWSTGMRQITRRTATLEKLTNVPAGVEALRAVGTVSKDDYETVFEPLVDQGRRAGRRLRFLYQIGPEFEGFTPGAAWEDARLGLSPCGCSTAARS